MVAIDRARVTSDALAIALATAVAFAFRAAVRDYDSLAPGHLASLIGPALLFAVPVSLLALYGAGLYRRDLAGEPAGLIEIASALAWAAAVLSFVATAWTKGPQAPVIVMAAGYPVAVALVLAGRRRLEGGRAAAARP